MKNPEKLTSDWSRRCFVREKPTKTWRPDGSVRWAMVWCQKHPFLRENTHFNKTHTHTHTHQNHHKKKKQLFSSYSCWFSVHWVSFHLLPAVYRPQPPLQIIMQLSQQIDDLLPLFHGRKKKTRRPKNDPPSNPGWFYLSRFVEPSMWFCLCWRGNEWLDDWCMAVSQLGLMICWFFQNDFVWGRQHTLEEYGKFWVHNDRFCFETQHVQFLILCFAPKMFSELIFPKDVFVALKFGVLNAKIKVPPWAKWNPTNIQTTPKFRSIHVKWFKKNVSFQSKSRKWKVVELMKKDDDSIEIGKIHPPENSFSAAQKKGDRQTWCWINPEPDKKKGWQPEISRRGLDFPKIHVLMCLLRRKASYSIGKMSMSSNNIPTVK